LETFRGSDAVIFFTEQGSRAVIVFHTLCTYTTLPITDLIWTTLPVFFTAQRADDLKIEAERSYSKQSSIYEYEITNTWLCIEFHNRTT